MKLVTGIFISVVLFAGCDNEDKNSSEEKANMIFKGSDYMALSTGKSMSFVASGSSTVYDSLGIVKKSKTFVKEELDLSVGFARSVNSVMAYPLYDTKNLISNIIAYIAVNNSEVIGLDGSKDKKLAIILPSEFKIGKEWIVNPQDQGGNQVKLKLVDFLGSFISKSDKKYQNVLKIELSHIGISIDEEKSWYYTKETVKVSGYFYFAKNEGLIETSITNFDREYYHIFLPSSSWQRVYYDHEIGNGIGSLK